MMTAPWQLISFVFALTLLFNPVLKAGQESAEAEAPIRLKKLVIFGDSLADTGNTRTLTRYFQGGVPRPDFFDHLFHFGWNRLPLKLFVGEIPPKHYYQGRFSNGPVSSELVAPMLGLDPEDGGQFVNLAFGGSWSLSGKNFLSSLYQLQDDEAWDVSGVLEHLSKGFSKWFIPSAQEVVRWYLDEHPVLEPDTMYVLFSGSNDYQNGYWQPEAVVSAQVDILEQLIDHGAKHIAWGTLPDITITPCFIGANTYPFKVQIERHNRMANNERIRLQQENPDIQLIFADGYSAFRLFFDNADSFGFTEKSKACTNVNVNGCPSGDGGPSIQGGLLESSYLGEPFKVCDHPEQYFFWDSIHPTTRVYEHVASYLCVMAGMSGYWTDCRLPADFDRPRAERLLHLLETHKLPSGVIPSRADIKRLLNI
ncbi:SGNH/GDSL hydrolase family protein [Parendozoicomonas haliclonae]|uniref:Thermolabile hemolysin n=1 Tax=Parendozoicomonas haliclonae TaxID=1960125 RepID=A0A1X7AGN0_9GAMM|nr:SGNH/GDSL hydrolase family protein [Parendozoicomonas haliclonae]SMA39214.1 Thermolabile hemolysin precursor [Parendozoicomonas haliclonae]